jgi:K+-sensing histidine kinase KdpD
VARFLTRDRAAIAAGLLGPLAAALVLLPLRAHWPNTNVALLLVVVVVAVAAMGNRIAGALAAASAFAWFDFFFTRPYLKFTMNSSADVTTAVLLLAVGLAVSQLAVRTRRLHVLAVTDSGYLDLIHQAAELSSTARTPDAVVDRVGTLLTGLLDLKACRFEYGALTGHPARIEPDGTVLAGHRRCDVAEFGWPPGEIEVRTFSNGEYCGRYMLTPAPDSRPNLQARLVAVTLADQAGRAIGASRQPARPA